jgi:hypothetical protein
MGRSCLKPALVLIVLLLAGLQTSASAGTASVYREKVDGYAFGFAGDCPAEPPAEPLVCTEWIIQPLRAGAADGGGGGVAPPKTPWELFLLRHTLTFPGGGGEGVESNVALAFVPVTDVTFDREHLRYASVRATDVVMSDGTTADVDAQWVGTSDRFVYGNDGPALEDFGLVPRHVNDDCLTANYQGHQKFRLAHMDAVVNGVQYGYDGGYISFNNFVFIEVHKQRCA